MVWTDGRDHPMNTPRTKPGASAAELAAAAAVGCTPMRSASFVSIMCDADVIGERGLPVADYFLWNDDFEYSTRLIRGRVGLYCPDSVVVHKTRAFGSTDADPGERFFYEVRNKVWLFSRSTGLSPAEKALYGGSTLRRWARTFAGSEDRGTLARGLARGMAAGLRAAPGPTARCSPRPAGRTSVATTPRRRPRRPPSRSRSRCCSPPTAGTTPEFLRLAFTSTVQEQTRRPDEVVLVQDGPVPPELAETIADLAATSPVPVKHVVMEDNVGPRAGARPRPRGVRATRSSPGWTPTT